MSWIPSLIASTEPPAAGAPIDQVVIATAFGIGITLVLVLLCVGHRTGKISLLAKGGRLAESVMPMPGWAGVPVTIAVVSLLPTLFGLQWDVAFHIGDGRDEGPLANPAHYFLLQGIFGAFAAGVIACAMADWRVPREGYAVPGFWRMPLGGLVAVLGGSLALLGFPLDDVWHRLYGQDVTLWGPTHVLMIAGMSVAVLGVVMLTVEGLRAGREERRKPEAATASAASAPHAKPPAPAAILSLLGVVYRVCIRFLPPAALLLVLSLLQGEFDYGVPQYRLLMHPMIVMGAAGTALVAARIYWGRGAALAAVIGFLVIRGVIALLVGPVLDGPGHVFPLYLASAVVVELVALRIGERRPLALGLWAGALIGTVGLAAEWAWSNVFAYPWTAALVPEAIILGFAMALAGSVVGAWIGSHMIVDRPIRTPALRRGAVVAAVAITAMIAYGLNKGEGEPVRGDVTLTEVASGPERTVDATVRLDPADAADGATWMHLIAWQGGGLISEPLDEVAPGVFETRSPVPVHGTWKSVVRLHTGNRLVGLPIFLPEDAEIPAEEIPAPASFEREFVDEKQLLQREARDVASGLFTLGTMIVALLCFLMLGLAALALHRLGTYAPDPEREAAR